MYNGDGQRIKKTEWNPTSQQGETIIYIYSQGKVCYEKNVTTGLDAVFVYGPTGRIAKKIGEETMYYHTDQLGSTRLLTDLAGNPVTAVGYNPFGGPEITGAHEQYLFTGHELDTTGLYYCKARYYNPDTGRFLTQDAWMGNYREPQTLNKYVYCMNNPLKYTDPSGNRPLSVDELDKDFTVEDPDESQQSQTPDPAEFARMHSELVTLRIIVEMDPNGWNTSRKAMEAAMSVFDDPEQRKEFRKQWEETFIETNKKYATPEEAQKRFDEARMDMEGDLNCLMTIASEELQGVALGLFSSPSQTVDVLRKVAYIAEEYYNITVGDEYKAPPPNLEELCREEEEGMCSGTVLLCIFCGLALLMISSRSQRREIP